MAVVTCGGTDNEMRVRGEYRRIAALGGDWMNHRGTLGLLFGLATLLGMAATPVPAAATTPGTKSNFDLVGHNPLATPVDGTPVARGMNSALALYGHFVYIGSRTDGGHPHSGVLVVDATDTTAPKVVKEIAYTSVDPTFTTGITSRELRVWPQQKLLMVIYFGCSSIIHDCVGVSDVAGSVVQKIAFFDLTDPANPSLSQLYVPSATPHEMFLWVDPANPAGRALMFMTSPNAAAKSLLVTDISGWKQGKFPEIATYNSVAALGPGTTTHCPMNPSADSGGYDVRLHSISLTPDGNTLFMAHLGGGFAIVDSHEVTQGLAGAKFHLVTPPANRVCWDNQGAHSAVKIPGRDYVFLTQEIYGKGGALSAAFGPALGGCPWGWGRFVNITDPLKPVVVSHYKVAENQQAYCPAPTATDNFASFASHNPTPLPHLVLSSWHSGGLQAIGIDDPANPAQAGYYVPTPEAAAQSEDPVLTSDPNNKDAVWSYPIISNGLIYVTDIRNGLFILRYTGPHADEVSGVSFLEGNSNLGDAGRLAASAAPAPSPSPLPRVLPNTVGRSGGVLLPVAFLLLALIGAGGLRRRSA